MTGSGWFATSREGTDLRFGRSRISELGGYLDQQGFSRALVVTGAAEAADSRLLGPVERSLGGRLAGVFAQTVRSKSIESVYAGIDLMRTVGADVLVGLGGGSSLDTTREISVFAADGRALDDYRAAALRGDALEAPVATGPAVPVIVVPTTLAGACLTDQGSIEVLSAAESPSGFSVRTMGRTVPKAAFFDPELVELTPSDVLRGSAMNGYSKGIETVYSPRADPLSDAAAIHGVALMSSGLTALGTSGTDGLDAAVAGVALAQLHRKLSIAHSFGHGVARQHRIQQGLAHAVLLPHVLRFVLDHGQPRLPALARALDVDGSLPAARMADAVVDAVRGVRDALGLPARLRDLTGGAAVDVAGLATYISADDLMAGAPFASAPAERDIADVLTAAY